ncbi:MAG: single-stranded DNA-binding protein [bacterium]|nr:single-stranded DNA-binding protein [bacterium]
MNDINRTVVAGRLTRDPEGRDAGGTEVCNFSLAVNRKYKGEDKVSYIDCTAWAKGAEILMQYAKKGSQIIIDGRLEQQRWEKDGDKRSKVVIVIDNFQLVGGKQETENPF